MADPEWGRRWQTRRGIAAQRCQRQKQQAGIKEASQWLTPNGAGVGRRDEE